VVTDDEDRVIEIEVKKTRASSNWIWGAFKMPGSVLRELFELWREREERDEYIGTLVNAYLARGGAARGVRAGRAYVDVGTLHGYREAIRLLSAGVPAAPLSGSRNGHAADEAAVEEMDDELSVSPA